MRRVLCSVAAAVALAACSTPPTEPVPITPASEAAGAPIVRRPIVETPPPLAHAAPALPIVLPPTPPIVVPPDTLYVCVSGTAGQRQQTSIQFSPKIGELCRKHPEMGPCQYEGKVFRRSGGRVYAANGVEITMQTEAEYDKKVLRVRFKAN